MKNYTKIWRHHHTIYISEFLDTDTECIDKPIFKLIVILKVEIDPFFERMCFSDGAGSLCAC